MEILDFELAEKHLSLIEKKYTEIGFAGCLMLALFIKPLRDRDRYSSGECTKELYNDIIVLY